MKDLTSINENELDGALNALFLETYSRKEDECLARFCLEQDYNVTVNSKKEAELLARLNGKQGGGKNIILWSLAVLLIAVLSIVLYTTNNDDQKIIASSGQIKDINAKAVENLPQPLNQTSNINEEKPEHKLSVNSSPFNAVNADQTSSVIDSLEVAPVYIPQADPQPAEEKILPYFSKEGLSHFSKVKEKIIQKLVKIDDLLYGKTAPGATMYKNTEVIVPPFVMANFPVTNLEYKTFLADLVMQGRFEEMKKCLPKEEVWKEYGFNNLAKNYFSNEIYNDFPVVNVNTEAIAIYCEWLQVECNEQLSASYTNAKFSKNKNVGKKKQVIVRLPYDYEWIYSADAAFALIPDCQNGYNTIYDPSEGLVDKGFFKRTSQVNKIDKSKETPMDKLSDVNRFGMTEEEIIAIYKKAINYKDVKSKSTGNPASPESYPDNVEACCLAGHVSELIKSKDGEIKVRGCCWKDKEEYLKMMEVYNKNGASPFIGFRVVILNSERGSDKNPFW